MKLDIVLRDGENLAMVVAMRSGKQTHSGQCR